jgi:two-component system, cell cycle response regulator
MDSGEHPRTRTAPTLRSANTGRGAAMRGSQRVLLIDANHAGRGVLAQRLRLQGFVVLECADGADGAVQALEVPPTAVIADLTMPSISGVQLCRLLGSEANTNKVPVILRGPEGRRNHFWAEQAGAFAYVIKGRMGELVRALRRAVDHSDARVCESLPPSATDGLDVRERIATHLDAALFESVIAAEVRRLGTSESFDRLVDLLSQFVSQVTTYRWMGLLRYAPPRLGIHANAASYEKTMTEARQALGIDVTTSVFSIEDDDAVPDADGPPPVLCPIHFGEQLLGVFLLAPRAPARQGDPALARIIAQELGGALRMASLVEESRLMATTDPLTGLLNRRAFVEQVMQDFRRTARYSDSFSVILLDIDHFKKINDEKGHTSGDAVLVAIARLLGESVRDCDVVARWGGEEFVIALPCTPLEGAEELAERIRARVEALEVFDVGGNRVHVTASFGAAMQSCDDTLEHLIDRADRAMYTAKGSGRNRVHLFRNASTPVLEPPLLSAQRAV